MKKSLLLVAIIYFVVSCSSSKEIGSREIVQTSGSKPDWAKDSKVFEKTDSKLFFETTLQDEPYLDIARTEADRILRTEVAKKLQTNVKEKLRSIIRKQGRRDKSNVEDLLNHAVEISTKNITIVGFNITDMYWERYKVHGQYGVDYLYDVYCRGGIPLSTFNTLYKQSINNLINSDNKELENLGKELLNSL
jgi:hypothetical protein